MSRPFFFTDGLGTAVLAGCDADHKGGERSCQVSPVLARAVRDGGLRRAADHVREGWDGRRSFTVRRVKEEETPSFAFREFNVTHVETSEERHIRHMQYIAWPDHGVPDDPADFLDFVLRRPRRLPRLRAQGAAEQGGHGRTRHRSLQVRRYISVLIEYCGGWVGWGAQGAAEQGGHGRTRHRSLQVRRCHISVLIEYCGGWVGWGGIRAKSAAEQGGHGRTRHRSLQVRRCVISVS